MHSHHDHHHHHGAPQSASQTLADTQAVCPVTDDIVDKAEAEKLGHVREYEGETYYLCCATCVQLFDKNPKKYTDERQAAGSLKLTEKEHLVDNVWAFRFEPDQPLSWVPGQFIRVALEHENPDAEGTKRWFTVSSTPHDGFVQITTRITESTFKQALASLAVGDTVNLIEQPDGDFVWQDDESPLVFVAAGIGVTPFYSILKARGHSGLPVPVTLIYNGRTDDLPFRAEFDEASRRHPELTIDYVIGERLTADKLAKLVPDLNKSQVYVSGPEPMVETLSKQLTDGGLAEANLHQDFFPNYSEENY